LGDRRWAAAGTCGGKAWAGGGNISETGSGWASSVVRESVRAGACGASAGADSWGDEGVATAGSREGDEAAGMRSVGNGTASDAVMWVSLRSGYTSCMAVLKSCQSLGSSIVSRVVDQVSHEASSV
jgi:hypothetical protein